MQLFSRRKTPPPEPTFNERVDTFWKWYASAADRFFQTIEDGRCSDLATEVSAKIDELLPGFSWVFGPGETGGHSLTLSGEGVMDRQILASHWLSRAPRLDGWTFYASRQPGRFARLHIEGIDFAASEIWVTPSMNHDAEVIDLTVWHPAWETLDDRAKFKVAFLFLDEALGEYGTGWWIGRIHFGKDKLAASFPLAELPDHIHRLSETEGWKKYPPGEYTTLLRFKEVKGTFPRSDTLTQTTLVPPLIRDYFDAEGSLDNPLAGLGADFAYVSLPNHILPKGGEMKKRGEFEDAMDAALNPEGLGRCIGGALGAERVYIDLLLLHGPRSLDAVASALRRLSAPSGTMIEFFARDKLARRIAL